MKSNYDLAVFNEDFSSAWIIFIKQVIVDAIFEPNIWYQHGFGFGSFHCMHIDL